MQIASLTKERKEELEKMSKDKAIELEKVKKTSIQQMWGRDLDQLETAFKSLIEALEDGAADGTGQKRKSGRGGRGGKGGRQCAEENEEEDEEELDGDGTAVVDPLDNPFADVSKWTMGALKSWTASSAGSSKRRRVG